MEYYLYSVFFKVIWIDGGYYEKQRTGNDRNQCESKR